MKQKVSAKTVMKVNRLMKEALNLAYRVGYDNGCADTKKAKKK